MSFSNSSSSVTPHDEIDFFPDLGNGRYGPTLLIGLGGTGAKALEHLRRVLLERLGSCDLPGVAYLSIDTDMQPGGQAQNHPYAGQIRFASDERVLMKAKLEKYSNDLDKHPHVKEWLDPSSLMLDSDALSKGAGQIRPISRLCFFDSVNDILDGLKRCQAKILSADIKHPAFDGMRKSRVVIVTGLAGGTGSGAFLDLAALIRSSWAGGSGLNLEGIFVLPGVYRDFDGAYSKLAANGYAALRELNHYFSHPFKVSWGRGLSADLDRLYDRCTVISGTNAVGRMFASASDAAEMIGEALANDFCGGEMKGWIDGVRINREQYLGGHIAYEYQYTDEEGMKHQCHADRWDTGFVSIGLRRLVTPGHRILNHASHELARLLLSRAFPSVSDAESEALDHLDSTLAQCQGFFSMAPHSSIVTEIGDFDGTQASGLDGYLLEDTTTCEEQLESLARSLRQDLGLGDPESQIAALNEPDATVRRLAAWCRRALHGNADGETHYFGVRPRRGMLQKHSLGAYWSRIDDETEKKFLKELYNSGLPWVMPKLEQGAVEGVIRPVADAFLGLGRGCDKTDEDFILKELEKHIVGDFHPNKVKTNDPTEIVFFTEWTAFPASFIGELLGSNGGKSHYERLLFDPALVAPLHLHMDFHEFQDLIPLNSKQVQEAQTAWASFIKAQMLGLIVSARQRRGDDVRVKFLYKTETPDGPKVEELGVQANVLRMLQEEQDFKRSIFHKIDQAEDRFLEAGGGYENLWLLAEYYLHCCYPVVLVKDPGGGMATQPVGSAASIAAQELVDEYKQKLASAMGLEPSGTEFLVFLREQRDSWLATRNDEWGLERWAVPIFLRAGKPVPRVPNASDPFILWPPRDQVASSITAWDKAELAPVFDDQGHPIVAFPRLALRWSFFLPPVAASPPPLPPVAFPPSDTDRVAELEAQVAALAAEVSELRVENEKLKAQPSE